MEIIQPLLFWIIAILTGVSAIAVVVTQNIVRSATWLFFSLAGTAGIFFLLGADLVGAAQLLVYAGGTLILVVFGVMLTAQGPFITMKTSSAEWAISALVGVLLLSVLVISVLPLRNAGKVGPPKDSTTAEYAPIKRLVQEATKGEEVAQAKYTATLGQGFLGVGVGPAHDEPIYGKQRIGETSTSRVVRTSYLLPFEIVSVHLLVVLIGAAYLARAKRRRRVEA